MRNFFNKTFAWQRLTILVVAALALQSAWAAIPRPEYPRPQFERTEWINLNGPWTCELDFSQSGMDRKLTNSTGFATPITVPFCPESELSGVQYVDFIPEMWYHRTIQVPQDWTDKQTLLHFGAVDFFAAVYVDGELVGRHWGGSSPFTFDITKYVKDGKEHNLVVRVKDDVRSGTQPRGKQSSEYYSHGCDYTRTTGIWQTVWMEPVDALSIESAYIVPDYDESTFVITPSFSKIANGATLQATVKDGNKVVAKASKKISPSMTLQLPIKNAKSWSPESPFLYDIELSLCDADGREVDNVKSYAGMRKIHIEGNRMYLNNEPYFLRLVLDQGFYPDGIWTAPSDEALRHDIELSQAAGFNGARLHQKAFEERFHYWADKMGYLTWAETPSWGGDCNRIETARNFLSEWETLVVRDRNHPSVIAWTPFNETWERPVNSEAAMQHDRLISDAYKLTHHLDYRPVNDTSGNYHVCTDLWTVHSYKQDPKDLAEWFVVKDGQYPCQDPQREVAYGGQPFLIDEYGGIKWVDGQEFNSSSWGYGEGPKTIEEFYTRLEGLTNAILEVPYMMGYCYTQLTNVEQEENGIYNYDRSPKFDMERIRAIFSKNPAPAK